MAPKVLLVRGWEPGTWQAYLDRQRDDPKIVGRLNEDIRDTLRQPFEGIGTPEPLGHQLKGT